MSAQDVLRKALLDAAGETRYVLDNEITPLWVDLIQGNSLLDLLSQLNAANGTRHFIRPSDTRDNWYDYVTRNRQYMLGVAATATMDASAEHVTAIDGWRVSADTVINRQKATVSPMTFPLNPIEVYRYDSNPPLPFTVVVGVPFIIQVTYPDYVPACPTLVYAYTGVEPTVTFTHHGWTSDITLSSASSSTITALSVLGDETVRANDVVYTANDAVSQVLPRGVRAGPDISGDLVGPAPAGVGIASHIVWRYGEPKIRPQLVVVNWPTAFTVDLYDTIAFTSAQLDVAAGIYEIVGLSETYDRAAAGAFSYTTTYQLQQQQVHEKFFTLDQSDLDQTDYLAY